MTHEQIALFDLPEAPKSTPETTRITVPKHLESQVLEFLEMLKAPAKGLIKTQPFTVTIADATQKKRFLVSSVTVTEEENQIVEEALDRLLKELNRLKLGDSGPFYALASIAEQCGVEVEVKE